MLVNVLLKITSPREEKSVSVSLSIDSFIFIYFLLFIFVNLIQSFHDMIIKITLNLNLQGKLWATSTQVKVQEIINVQNLCFGVITQAVLHKCKNVLLTSPLFKYITKKTNDQDAYCLILLLIVRLLVSLLSVSLSR